MKKLGSLMGLMLYLGANASGHAQTIKTENVEYLAREVFINRLLQRMTQDEKIGQLRLLNLAVGPHPPNTRLLTEIRAGKAGGIFNAVTPQDVRMYQAAALQSRLKIPLFFAYDILHGYRTIFP